MDVHAAAAARLDAAGQRYTSGRRALVDRLVGLTGPAGIDAVRGGLPLSSVYRNLTVLEEAGVVRRVPGPGDSALYELAEDLTEHHHHLHCQNCGRAEDFVMPASLERALDRAVAAAAQRVGFQALSHDLDFVGLCADCRR